VQMQLVDMIVSRVAVLLSGGGPYNGVLLLL